MTKKDTDSSGPHFETAAEWAKWIRAEFERLNPTLNRHRCRLANAGTSNTGTWDVDVVDDPDFRNEFCRDYRVAWDVLGRSHDWAVTSGLTAGLPTFPADTRLEPSDLMTEADRSLALLRQFTKDLLAFLDAAAVQAVEVAFIGDGRFRCGADVIQLVDAEANVLETLVSFGAISLDDLRNATNTASPQKVLKRITEKFPALARAITLPGGKGRGGYQTTIKDESGG